MEGTNTQPAAAATPATSSTPSSDLDPKTMAILSWLFAPITSYFWKDHQDAFVKNHAQESFLFGVLSVIVTIVLMVLNACIGITAAFIPYLDVMISCLFSLVWMIFSLLMLVPRIIGIIKALNGEKWTVPYVSEFMRKYIKM